MCEGTVVLFVLVYVNWIAVLFQTSPVVAAGMAAFLLSTVIFTISGVLSRLVSKTYREMNIRDQHCWNAGVVRSSVGLMLATRGMYAFIWGAPDGGIVWGYNPYLQKTAAFALGVFLFETRDSLNMYLAYGVIAETLIVSLVTMQCHFNEFFNVFVFLTS